MEKLIIKGGNRLEGCVSISGAKNSALKVLCASILTSERIRLFNIPTGLEDVRASIDMIKSVGAKVFIKNNTVTIDNSSINNYDVSIPNDKDIRTSLLMLGSLLGKHGKAKVPLPGGCNIGDRKFDLHIYALERLGAKVKITDDGYIEAETTGLQGAEIEFPFLTMGGTENSIIASCLAKGLTTIKNAYVTPEVLDLIRFLKYMGAEIKVKGSRYVKIDGVKQLHGTGHTIIPDRLEALTFIVAGAVTKGFVEIEEFPIDFLGIPLIYLEEAGVIFHKGRRSVIVDGQGAFSPLEIVAGSYPGVISDMQPLFSVFATQSLGVSRIIDVRYPSRFGYIKYLQRMGADINQEGNIAVINGPTRLKGSDVNAENLRAGAALICGALCAEGKTAIENVYQIDRGYERIEQKLKDLGANITRVIRE